MPQGDNQWRVDVAERVEQGCLPDTPDHERGYCQLCAARATTTRWREQTRDGRAETLWCAGEPGKCDPSELRSFISGPDAPTPESLPVRATISKNTDEGHQADQQQAETRGFVGNPAQMGFRAPFPAFPIFASPANHAADKRDKGYNQAGEAHAAA